MPKHLSKKNVVKTVIVNRTSQYRVGVFNNHYFFACFFRGFAWAFSEKFCAKKVHDFEQKKRHFFRAGDHASGLPRGHFGAKGAQRTRCGVRNDAAFEFQRSKSVDFCRPKVNPCVSLWRTLGGFGTKSLFWNTASNLESTIDPAFSRKKEIYYLYNLPFSKGQ